MARYTGPTCKQARRAQTDLFLKTRPAEAKCKLDQLPGQHGKTHTTVSAHGKAWREKQKVKRVYGVLVNGKAVNIPSYQVAPGDIVEVKEAGKTQARVQEALQLAAQRTAVVWLEVDAKKVQGKFISIPDRSDLPSEFNENLIVELYSK